MGMGNFFSSNLPLIKRFTSTAETNPSTPATDPAATQNKNIVSLVEHRFKRMTEQHDRIRSQMLTRSRTQVGDH